MIEQVEAQIDKTSPIPLYEQLRQALLDAIISGKIPVGAKLLTEEELCTRFSVSRPVARQAYSALISEGYVERRRGRGTFVRMPDILGRFLQTQLSFTEEMEITGHSHRTELVRADWLDQAPEIFTRLRMEENDRCYRLLRMRYVEGRPYVLVENFIPESIFPGIDRFDLAQNSLYKIFASEYHLTIPRSRRTIGAQIADAEFARLFEVQPGSPVLYVENLVYDQYDRPIDFSREYMDGLARKFEFEVVNK